jgi:hypothetical protein
LATALNLYPKIKEGLLPHSQFFECPLHNHCQTSRKGADDRKRKPIAPFIISLMVDLPQQRSSGFPDLSLIVFASSILALPLFPCKKHLIGNSF